MSEYYGTPTASSDFLAHYGVKGMRWGVRKAIASGNERALNRHYRKAAKKLAKLQDIGLRSKKYAAKSAAYGAAAAGTGTLAVGGTKMLSNIATPIGKYISLKTARKTDSGIVIRDGDLELIGRRIEDWGRHKAFGSDKKLVRQNRLRFDSNGKMHVTQKRPLSNNDLYRIGMGVATAGFLVKSAQNAYRASNGAKYRKKAHQWKKEMDESFAGTPYEGHYEKLPRKRKQRR